MYVLVYTCVVTNYVCIRIYVCMFRIKTLQKLSEDSRNLTHIPFSVFPFSGPFDLSLCSHIK